MEQFVGKWRQSTMDFEKMKALYAKMGAPEAALDGQKEHWKTSYIEVAENGTHWKYGNDSAPGGDATVTFDMAEKVCNRTGKGGVIKSTFEMKGDTEMVIHNPNGLKLTAKMAGHEMKLTQTLDDVSVDTVYTKSE
ncbi:uncharacterized protein LOC118418708 [Branchiostoma floridae]|uniref:Uncharacterized protein LOC118418708 n=1 Tax=Branchiostoma floridae TaxID=7739 RepID=A0A9J7LEL6_BRAFL|nr:uncharacterized protein LOC118418708 [Branchiostoma floridae]